MRLGTIRVMFGTTRHKLGPLWPGRSRPDRPIGSPLARLVAIKSAVQIKTAVQIRKKTQIAKRRIVHDARSLYTLQTA